MKTEVLEMLFNNKYFDPYRAYRDIDTRIKNNQAAGINEAIRNRLKVEQPPTLNNVLLAGAVLFRTGSKEKDLITFFLKQVTTRINIDQYLFLICAIYDNKPPVSSEIMFDLINYTYLDNEVIQKKLDELTASLNKNLTKRIVLFLLLLSMRQDVANENYRIIVLVLNNISPDVITLARKFSVFTEYGDIVDEAMRAKIKMSVAAEKEIKNEAYSRKKTAKSKAATASQEDEGKSKAAASTGANKHVPKKTPTVKKTATAKRVVKPVKPAASRTTKPSEKKPAAKKTVGKNVDEKKTPENVVDKGKTSEMHGSGLLMLLHRKRVLYIGSAAAAIVLAVILVFVFTERDKTSRSDHAVAETAGGADVAVNDVQGNGSGESARNVASVQETVISDNVPGRNQPEMVKDTPLTADAVVGPYVVKKGDTLSHISKKYLNDANRYYEIASENRIENPDLIYPGQRIVVTTEQ